MTEPATKTVTLEADLYLPPGRVKHDKGSTVTLPAAAADSLIEAKVAAEVQAKAEVADGDHEHDHA